MSGDWRAVGTASIYFLRPVTDLARSERVSSTMRQVLAETRLFVVLVEDSRAFFEPYLTERALDGYLRHAEKQLLAPCRRQV